MIRFALTAAGLTAVYLLVLSSLALGDVLLGGLLGIVVAFELRPRGAGPEASRPARIGAVAQTFGATAAEMVRGSWRVARFCLGAQTQPRFVEIPRDGRSRHHVALWGVLTSLAPDEIVVDVDEERDVLIIHVVDAPDPDAIRERHAGGRDRQGRVVR